MRKIIVASLSAAVFVLTGAAACDPVPVAEPGDMSKALAPGGMPPVPDKATTDRYVADLKKISVKIGSGNVSNLVLDGRNQCNDLVRIPGQTASQIANARTRFGATDDQAVRIIAVVKRHICPTF